MIKKMKILRKEIKGFCNCTKKTFYSLRWPFSILFEWTISAVSDFGIVPFSYCNPAGVFPQAWYSVLTTLLTSLNTLERGWRHSREWKGCRTWIVKIKIGFGWVMESSHLCLNVAWQSELLKENPPKCCLSGDKIKKDFCNVTVSLDGFWILNIWYICMVILQVSHAFTRVDHGFPFKYAVPYLSGLYSVTLCFIALCCAFTVVNV